VRQEIKEAMLSLKNELVIPHEPCEGSGWLDSEVRGEPNPCECMVIFHYLNTLIEAKIPREYWWLPIDDLQVAPEYKKLCKWYSARLENAASGGLGVLFLGPNGIGKTSMQCYIGKEAVINRYSVQYFTAQKYIESRKMDDSTLSEEYENAKFLLLDELDKVYIKNRSNFVVKTLEDFIRRKTSDGSVFIICTNHDENTLENVFGQSTISMLKRHLKFINIEGSDYSETLQDNWERMMRTDRNYFDEHISECAYRLLNREREEDKVGWEESTY
jgi:DNA replication protein DnaC